MAKARIPIERAISEGWFTPNQNNGYCECGCGDLAPIAKKTGRDQGILIGESQHFIMGHANKLHAVARMITQEEAAAEGWHKPNTNDGYCHCGCGKKTQIAPKISRLTGTLQGEHYQFCKGHKRVPEPPPDIEWNESGLCLCGCGGKTEIAKKSNYERDILNGKPKWYIQNHKPETETKYLGGLNTSTVIQRCTSCKDEKPLKDFRKKKSEENGRVKMCKECWDQMPSQTPQSVLNRTYLTRMRNKKFVFEYMNSHPCVDCGEADPIVLEFHHTDPTTKTAGVSKLVHNTVALTRIQAEIDKCEIICANCHKRRTAASQGWTKFAGEFIVDLTGAEYIPQRSQMIVEM